MSFNTFPQNPFPPNSENAGGGGSPYVLPIASAETLGGVKVGNNLTIGESGALNAPAPCTPLDYSTTEQATGQKWIDGKDIYAKTFSFDTTSAQQTEIDVTSCAIDTNIAERINCGPVTNTYYFESTDFLRTYLKTNNTILTIERGSNSVKGAGSITLYYTKSESEE